jgi:hypothetical protein
VHNDARRLPPSVPGLEFPPKEQAHQYLRTIPNVEAPEFFEETQPTEKISLIQVERNILSFTTPGSFDNKVRDYVTATGDFGCSWIRHHCKEGANPLSQAIRALIGLSKPPNEFKFNAKALYRLGQISSHSLGGVPTSLED